jgi:hypothetical protein
MKLRIIEEIQNVNDGKERKIHFIVEQKTFWGWKEVLVTHSTLRTKRLSHSTYQEAEEYIYQNYMGHGECRKNGNQYTYSSYTYFV